jgi:DinB superfamily
MEADGSGRTEWISERRNKRMSELSNVITNGFINTYRDLGARVRTLSEELSERQFWTKPYPYGNSVGHLTLHIIGNLNYFIGAQIAQTGYVRDRDREFTEDNPSSKEDVLRRLDETVEMVVRTLEAQTTDSWGTEYRAAGWDSLNNRFTTFLRCAAHFQHHIGQMLYLTNEHTK